MNDQASIAVRPAREGEEDAIRGLVRRAYAMYVPRMGKEPGPMVDDYAARVAEGAAYVLERGGAGLGRRTSFRRSCRHRNWRSYAHSWRNGLVVFAGG